MDFCTRNIPQMSSMLHAKCIKLETNYEFTGNNTATYDDERPLDLRVCTNRVLSTPTTREESFVYKCENTSLPEQMLVTSATLSTSNTLLSPSLDTSVTQSHLQDHKVTKFVVKSEAHTSRRSLKSHTCERCNYSTDAEAKFREHLKAHRGRFICKNCNKACIKSSDLFRHWLSHGVRTTDGRYLCDSCDFATLERNTLEDHMKCHYHLRRANQNKLCAVWSRCGMCDERVPRSKIFEHKRTVHGCFFMKPRAGTCLERQSEVVISGKENSSCLDKIKT